MNRRCMECHATIRPGEDFELRDEGEEAICADCLREQAQDDADEGRWDAADAAMDMREGA